MVGPEKRKEVAEAIVRLRLLRCDHLQILDHAQVMELTVLHHLDLDVFNDFTRAREAFDHSGQPAVVFDSGKGLSLCESLAQTLEQRVPDSNELNQLEQIAMTLDKECSSTLARIKGKR